MNVHPELQEILYRAKIVLHRIYREKFRSARRLAGEMVMSNYEADLKKLNRRLIKRFHKRGHGVSDSVKTQ